MVDIVKVSVLERDGSEFDYGSESTDTDQIRSGGLISSSTLNFEDSETQANVKLNQLYQGAGFGAAGRYAVPLVYNGTVGNGTFIGYSNLVNGLDTPIVIPRNCSLQDLTFSNANANADYTLYLRKNSPTATEFKSITKTNTQTFTEQGINQDFLAGDTVYIEYQDDGQNVNDVVIVLFFRNDAVVP